MFLLVLQSLKSFDTYTSLVAINVSAQAPIKLTSTNFVAWRLQFHSLLIGHDLMGSVDGTLPCPAQFNTMIDGHTLNPAYSLFFFVPKKVCT